ncbi:MAG: hypothetical protein Q8N00_14555 [Nitrospirota bacterium]|nr:hypothetical protein [Nitrospirota bacterium]MDP3596085.1 hypothetical protein [Nitrospirota bacterium]
MKRLFVLALAGWVITGAVSFAGLAQDNESIESKPAASEAIVQIFGRMCEYHREDVEAALRAFKTVRQVEFLNNHGTVLVRYQPGSETPEQLAGAVHRALASGWNCSARVDRGEQRLEAGQQEGKS